jgi:predicted transcriptional regulator
MPLGHSNFFSIVILPYLANEMQAQAYISYGIVNTKQYHLYAGVNNLSVMESINQLTKKGASCTDLLTCLYNLKPPDLQVFRAVAKNEGTSLDQIAKLLQKDRSSVHRCLAKLVSLDLVSKQTMTLKGGGYYHSYTVQNPATIKEHAQEKVREIIASLNRLVDRFESDFQTHMNA